MNGEKLTDDNLMELCENAWTRQRVSPLEEGPGTGPSAISWVQSVAVEWWHRLVAFCHHPQDRSMPQG